MLRIYHGAVNYLMLAWQNGELLQQGLYLQLSLFDKLQGNYQASTLPPLEKFSARENRYQQLNSVLVQRLDHL